jgi:hypothetical protein
VPFCHYMLQRHGSMSNWTELAPLDAPSCVGRRRYGVYGVLGGVNCFSSRLLTWEVRKTKPLLILLSALDRRPIDASLGWNKGYFFGKQHRPALWRESKVIIIC